MIYYVVHRMKDELIYPVRADMEGGIKVDGRQEAGNRLLKEYA